jgi:sigma-B regulation protein RsbU (phosphoserine phosphatase)
MTVANASKPLRILIVEDSEIDTELLLRELRRGNYRPTFERVETAAAMTTALEEKTWDLVVADFSMPQFNALAALEVAKAKGPDLPFIIVSGTIGEELAVAAMKNGAKDYIMKGNLARLVPAVERELREAAVRAEQKRAEERLRETQEEFRVAREIQQRLFPKTSPQPGPFDIAGATHPAQATGGDYFDYVTMADGCLGIVVADVTGHGVGPALLMAETRAYLRTLAMNATDVGEILTGTHRALADDVDLERYVTLLLAKLDPRTQLLTYASAGHPTGYVLAPTGAVKALLKPTGVPFGAPLKAPYTAAAPIPLAAGDIVLLVTDGIEEATAPDNGLFGVQRILDVVRSHAQNTAREILQAIEHAVHQFSHNQPQLDDMTVAVVKVCPTHLLNSR